MAVRWSLSTWSNSLRNASGKSLSAMSSVTEKDTDGMMYDLDLNAKVSYHPHKALEQINEDLYARNNNIFMVYTGVGVDTKNDNNPVTEVGD